MSRIGIKCLILLLFYAKIWVMEDLNLIIGHNICEYRKKNNLTQVELASKINYSDKSISKWEKGDGVPDIYVLKALSEIFNVTVNDLIKKHEEGKIKSTLNKNKKVIIAILSVMLVWLVAIVSYVLLRWIASHLRCWLVFILAIPISFIVGYVFTALWAKKTMKIICSSGIVWGSILSFCMAFSFHESWMLYFVGIPLQIMIILWFIFISKDNKK